MPHRSGGRHRRQSPRHRVPRRSASPSVSSARGRALALSATLCAALLTGTAGRDAAAAHPHHDAAPFSPAGTGPKTSAQTDSHAPNATTDGTTSAQTDDYGPNATTGRTTSAQTDDYGPSDRTTNAQTDDYGPSATAGRTTSAQTDDYAPSDRTTGAQTGYDPSAASDPGTNAQPGVGGLEAAAGPVPETGVGSPWEVAVGVDGDVPSVARPGAVAVRRKPRTVAMLFVVGGAGWVNPNPTATVTSCFGPRWGRQHEGVDLAAADGSPILAAGAGVVVRAGAAEGYGNAVLIDHGDGYLTHYGHLATIAVRAGQHVRAGERIGDEGSTGHSTGPHLHFEVHRGTYKNPVEPTRWMHEHGVDIRGCATF